MKRLISYLKLGLVLALLIVVWHFVCTHGKHEFDCDDYYCKIKGIQVTHAAVLKETESFSDTIHRNRELELRINCNLAIYHNDSNKPQAGLEKYVCIKTDDKISDLTIMCTDTFDENHPPHSSLNDLFSKTWYGKTDILTSKYGYSTASIKSYLNEFNAHPKSYYLTKDNFFFQLKKRPAIGSAHKFIVEIKLANGESYRDSTKKILFLP